MLYKTGSVGQIESVGSVVGRLADRLVGLLILADRLVGILVGILGENRSIR